MNIVLFTDTYLPEINGVATSLFNLHKTLVEHGEKVLVVASNGPDSKKIEVTDDIIRIAGFEAMKGYDYHIASFYNQKVFEMVRDFEPDLIHSNHDGPIGQFGFICASRLNLPVVYTYHTMYEDYTHYVTKGHFDVFAKKIVRGYINLKSVQADEFIAPSEKIKNYFRSIGVDKYINVVPTGIDFGKFMKPSMNEEEKAQLKKSLGISQKDYVLLFLGRIAKEKSIDVLIRGYADYLAGGESRPTKFLIVGGGPLLDELKALAEELGIADHV
ncbi:MAG: glycosyltransferase, partial [Bacilli bacterium]|nr:glycosyltransferase [Bacilli bacterium]